MRIWSPQYCSGSCGPSQARPGTTALAGSRGCSKTQDRQSPYLHVAQGRFHCVDCLVVFSWRWLAHSCFTESRSIGCTKWSTSRMHGRTRGRLPEAVHATRSSDSRLFMQQIVAVIRTSPGSCLARCFDAGPCWVVVGSKDGRSDESTISWHSRVERRRRLLDRARHRSGARTIEASC